ncbi:MAG: hypothetical protein WCK00_16060, partial [Deltaproteobacteria bacterium]
RDNRPGRARIPRLRPFPRLPLTLRLSPAGGYLTARDLRCPLLHSRAAIGAFCDVLRNLGAAGAADDERIRGFRHRRCDLSPLCSRQRRAIDGTL